MRIDPRFLFDLDGTLVDSVYHHVLAWKRALASEGIELSVWRIHRRIGMSGGLFTHQLMRETGLEIDAALIERLRERHARAYQAGRFDSTASWCARVARHVVERRYRLGDRHERPHGDGR